MLERLLEWDRETFLYLNGLGIEQYDGFWSLTTDMYTWVPLFILFLLLILDRHPKKEALLMSAWVIVLALAILVLTTLIKEYVGRLRPNNDETISSLIRILKRPAGFSFFSGHAASSFSITTLVVLFIRNKFSWAWVFFGWPLLFSFSRIYVGVHYPLDILTGAGVGVLAGALFYKAYYRFIAPGSGSVRP